MRKVNSKKRIIIGVISLCIVIFALVFFLYDSPAQYVKTPDGSIYLNQNGEPILYYTDLFGLSFYNDNGKRDYSAVPATIEPITNAEALEELQEAVD